MAGLGRRANVQAAVKTKVSAPLVADRYSAQFQPIQHFV